MPRTADERAWGGQELGERHREVLRAGLELIAERGYAGASLRELGRRVGMQQPSLYHYFKSKEQLVDQILRTFGFGGMYSVPAGMTLPDRVEELPAALRAFVDALYAGSDWPTFVRFVFNLALEQSSYAPRLRAMFVDTVNELFEVMLSHYVEDGQVEAHEAAFLARMVTSAIGLPYIEQKLIFAGAGVHPDMREYGDFVVRVAELALAARAGQPITAITPPSSTPSPRGDRRTAVRARPRAR